MQSCPQKIKHLPLTTFMMLFLTCVVTGCFSTQEKSLDVSLKDDSATAKEQAVPQPATANPATAQDPADPKVISGSTVFAWQHDFKHAPTEAERTQIQQKLETWVDAKDTKELMNKAQMQMAIGLVDEAEVSYRSILRFEPNNTEVYLDLANLYLRRRNIDKCFDYIEQANQYITKNENVPRDYKFRYKFVLGQALMMRGDMKKGRRIISDLVAYDRTFIPGYAVLANSYLLQNKLDLAEFIALRGIDRSREDARLANIISVVAARKGNKIKASGWISKAIEIDPGYTPALVNRAGLAIGQGHFEAAEADLKRAIALAPDSVAAHIALGVIYKRTGRFDLAKNSFNKAIDLDPESAHARYNLGILMLETYKNRAEAVRLFHETLQASDNDEEVKEMAKAQINGLKENSYL